MLNLSLDNNYKSVAAATVLMAIVFVFFSALSKYQGQAGIYILFTLVFNGLLFIGLNKKAIFFDLFIGASLWLGFWLKFSLRVGYFEGIFHESVGEFDATGGAYDQVLLVATCGALGFIVASLIRRKFFFNFPAKQEGLKYLNLYEYYIKYRKPILISFLCLVSFVAITNGMFSFYQRGVPQTTLPFGANGVYKWLILFGLASFSTYILQFELKAKNKISFLIILLVLFECFASNVSLLSRGMVLNAGALIIGLMVCLKFYPIKSKAKFYFGITVMTLVLFISSVFIVNFLRANMHTAPLVQTARTDAAEAARLKEARIEGVLAAAVYMAAPLLVDRWVGVEGVMAVVGYDRLGWGMFQTALSERYDESKSSFYDDNLIESSYIGTDKAKHHFISLPGIIAFFFYPGSFVFLVVTMFCFGTFAAFIEFGTYKLGGGNVILCALIAQVVAFRLASFGYVPAQSYLLFGSIFLNLLLIFFAEKFIRFYKEKSIKNLLT